MALTRQKVPSFIFYAADSSSSLASLVTLQTLDTAETYPSSIRGVAPTFGKAGLDKILSSKAPSIPKRKSSMDMSFRRVPSSFAMDHQDSMRNARFDIGHSKKANKSLLLDRFGCLETIVSPCVTTRKTRPSVISDTPLTAPRRKPSEQSCSLSPSSLSLLNKSSSKQYKILSDLQNATFDELMNKKGGVPLTRISNTTL